MEARDPAVAAAAAAHPVARLQTELSPQVALLEYWTGTPASFLWVVTRGRVRGFRLPAAAVLNGLVSEWNEQMRRPFTAPAGSAAEYAAELASGRRQALRTVRRLRELLLPPGALPHGAATVLVVGDGAILSIPFDLLEPEDAFVREPSIAVLNNLLGRRALPPGGKIAIFADPANPEPRVWAAMGGAALPRLDHAAEEARALASLAGSGRVTLASGAAASGARVRATDWNGYAIVHFATHALLDPAFPELSSLLLAPPQPQLWYADIAGMRMPVGLVTLGACQTASGDLLPGEGLEGLAYAFFEAGARRVLGSLWDVDDAATAAFMTKFYTAVFAGAPPPQALRQAQRELAQKPRWRNPYYWSGFTLAGDWRPLPGR